MPGPNDVPPVDVGGTGVKTTPAAAATAQNRLTSLDRLRSLLGPAFKTATVTTDYGAPTWGSGLPHSGIDLAVAQGSSVQEPIGGIVAKVFSDSIGGNQVTIRTTQGYQETFAHLSAIPSSITPGATVMQGSTVGYAGQTGMASGPHLHYEITKSGGSLGTMLGSIDPLTFISEFAGPPGSSTTIDPFTGGVVLHTPGQPTTEAGGSNIGTGNPLDALGSIAANVGRLTGDLTNGQTWARLGLTLTAVAIIGVGIYLYVGAPMPKAMPVPV